MLETVDKDHGRLETRRYYQSAALDWFADRAQWEGLATVGMVEALREANGKPTVERRYYLSSPLLGVETFARAVRGHWGIENSLHRGTGRADGRGRQPGAHRLRRRKPGHTAPTGT
ncbi:MAG: ISAs1 family transposase [Verrucomicrobiota bacterium]